MSAVGRLRIKARGRTRPTFGQAGFTLLEVLIVTAILTTLVGGAYMLLQQGVLSWQVQGQRREVQENFRVALARMGKYVREAAGVKVEGSGTALTVTWYDPAATDSLKWKKWKQIRYEVKNGLLREGRLNKATADWQATPNPEIAYAWQPLAERVVGATFEVSGNGDSRLVTVSLVGRDQRGQEYRARTQFMVRVILPGL